MTFFCQSNAKVNLFLFVKPKSNQDYHEIDSLFIPIFDLFDDLSFTVVDNNQGEIYLCNFFTNIKPEDNLICQIFFYLKQHYCFNFSLKVHVKKRIKIGSGLGGGSSNAFFTAKVILQILKLPLQEQLIQTISSLFSQDLYFFYFNNLACVTGCGEKIIPLNVTFPFSVQLYQNNFPLLTKNIYQAYANIPGSLNWLQKKMLACDIIQKIIVQDHSVIRDFQNDLLVVAFASSPDFQQHYFNLQNELNTPIFMSGSGSCLFTLKHLYN